MTIEGCLLILLEGNFSLQHTRHFNTSHWHVNSTQEPLIFNSLPQYSSFQHVTSTQIRQFDESLQHKSVTSTRYGFYWLFLCWSDGETSTQIRFSDTKTSFQHFTSTQVRQYDTSRICFQVTCLSDGIRALKRRGPCVEVMCWNDRCVERGLLGLE